MTCELFMDVWAKAPRLETARRELQEAREAYEKAEIDEDEEGTPMPYHLVARVNELEREVGRLESAELRRQKLTVSSAGGVSRV